MLPTQTRNKWRCCLTHLQIGDVLDDEMLDEFIGELPPISLTGRIIQMGVPYTAASGKPTYATLHKIDGKWVYVGYCYRRQIKEVERANTPRLAEIHKI